MTFDVDSSLVPPGERVLTAVSGGADSLALLWWLKHAGRDVVAGHVHHDLHELRQGDCDRDAEFVTSVCTREGLRLHITQVDLPRRHGHVNEAVAREARYEALIEMARREGCSLLAVAHTATDTLETTLLNLMRGSGVRGLSGINAQRRINEELVLVRPFWRLGRQQTRAMLQAVGWEWREDASNLDPVFKRNQIRHSVLPLMEQIAGRDVDKVAVQHAYAARILRDELEWLDGEAKFALEGIVKKRDVNLIILDGLALREMPIALQRRMIRMAALELLAGHEVPFQAVEAVREWVLADNRRKVWSWAGGLRVEWTGAFAGNRVRFWRVSS